MHIIYHDESGSHSSMIAALIHLHLLPTDSIPRMDDLRSLPCFNHKNKKAYGRLLFQGKDEYNNEIYTLGRNHAGPLITNVLNTVPSMVEENHRVLCIDTSKYNGSCIILGSYCSTELSLHTIGGYLTAVGILKAYPGLIKLLKKTKLKIAP